ncbi:UDP-N-acetylmuramate--L-alanine ligase [Phototrophicus methaneseepsis]|uniref:UDP-N-acetylmuramate--L-alanine ligase n=1 Tax=Phototrophicus methaneseepsis TaxID=2710758 RepID=A0A7S8E7S8_9CHLR|nr:UDP-N-acetylmuramate--L-alanine ligase [Phototrophicus methaneseepsis]QPC81924.1 UDP-N-acetylmuramate--L-alanine ligase [Phototrophicus methaneseepsis]
MTLLKPGQQIHFIGVGGTGLSAIARVLLQRGYTVTGSDRNQGPLAASLAAEGVTVYIGHDAAYVDGADLVLRSSAVPDDHVEVQAALAQGIPVVKRSDMIAELMAGQQAICISGTHGKTTTTSMTAHILLTAGQDPSYIVGGVLMNTGQNAAAGQGPAFVIEADEYDYMFLGLKPDIAVVNNVEWDHPDFFKSPQQFTAAFERFVSLLSDEGVLVACADDAGSAALARARQHDGLPTITFGIQSADADWSARELAYEGGKLHFTVWRGNELLGSLALSIPGEHNVFNALAALIVADLQGVPFDTAAAALATFKGAGRRFDLRAEVDGIAIVDDYAHHPTAIRKMIDVAHARYPDRDVWAIWQPHTYSRTQELFDDFAKAFVAADHVIVTSIYAAREAPVPGITGEKLVQAMHHDDAYYAATFHDAAQRLIDGVQAPAVVLIMSAGDAPQIGVEYLAYLESQR